MSANFLEMSDDELLNLTPEQIAEMTASPSETTNQEVVVENEGGDDDGLGEAQGAGEAQGTAGADSAVAGDVEQANQDAGNEGDDTTPPESTGGAEADKTAKPDAAVDARLS